MQVSIQYFQAFQYFFTIGSFPCCFSVDTLWLPHNFINPFLYQDIQKQSYTKGQGLHLRRKTSHFYNLSSSSGLLYSVKQQKHDPLDSRCFKNYKKYWVQFGSLTWEYTWIMFSKYLQELKVQANMKYWFWLKVTRHGTLVLTSGMFHQLALVYIIYVHMW